MRYGDGQSVLCFVICGVDIPAEADFGRGDFPYGIKRASGYRRIFGDALRVRIGGIEDPSAGGIALPARNFRKLPAGLFYPGPLTVFVQLNGKLVQHAAGDGGAVRIFKGQYERIPGAAPVRCNAPG